MSVAKEKVQNFIQNLTQFVTFNEPQNYKNLTIIPLMLKDDILDFITIKEAEEADLGYIQEMGSEEVASLQAVNKGTKPILIPYMQVVKGGKQDRTIYEPILVPAGSSAEITIPIPSKCIERSRWAYRTAAERMSKKFSTSPQKMTIGLSAKAMRAPYRMRSMQSEVWGSIEAMSDQMAIGYGASPTRSGIQLQETQKGKLEDYSKHFKIVKNQAGLIGLVNNQVVAIELYGTPAAFKIFWKDLINSYVMEALLRGANAKKLKPLTPAEAHERALQCFEKHAMQFKERKGVGLGIIVEFTDANLIWAGISLVYDNKFVHLYVVGKSIFPDERPRVQQMRVSRLQRQINRPPRRESYTA
ncbi:MAG: hypothetical protein HWN65_09190 [Candidatus Helarchaeota archaeon]|nr:hypothetical protein [Candidatus Helarchaeota archaeon]